MGTGEKRVRVGRGMLCCLSISFTVIGPKCRDGEGLTFFFLILLEQKKFCILTFLRILAAVECLSKLAYGYVFFPLLSNNKGCPKINVEVCFYFLLQYVGQATPFHRTDYIRVPAQIDLLHA